MLCITHVYSRCVLSPNIGLTLIGWLNRCVFTNITEIFRKKKQRREMISSAFYAFVRAWASHVAEKILIVFQPGKGAPLI